MNVKHMVTAAVATAVFGAAGLSFGSPAAVVTAVLDPSSRTLIVFGDSLDNTVVVSRSAAGTIFLNNGAIPVIGGVPTVANVDTIQISGMSGNDTLVADESFGALPAVNAFGGSGDDVLRGGSNGDQLFGESGDDSLDGRGGADALFGGSDADDLTGGDADDQLVGEAGDDTTRWKPGDDDDVVEGGDGDDTVNVIGSAAAERFTVVPNGSLVRLDGGASSTFSLDIGTAEELDLDAGGRRDTIRAADGIASLISLVFDGGDDDDVIVTAEGADDALRGGTGFDVASGGTGSDTAPGVEERHGIP